jgi:beta-lactamase regulating signal transducer with metallopeptidase domain
LHRQLAALAEQACDEAVLQHLRPEQYAQILIEFAADVKITGGRVVAAPAVVSHRSSLKKRLERIFSPDRHLETHQRLIRFLLVALSVPVLYLASVASFNPLQAENNAGQAPYLLRIRCRPED